MPSIVRVDGAGAVLGVAAGLFGDGGRHGGVLGHVVDRGGHFFDRHGGVDGLRGLLLAAASPARW